MPARSRTLVAVTSDLFLQSRITELAASLGVTAGFAANSEGLMKTVTRDTFLVVLDLSSTDYDPFSIAKTLKANRPSLRTLGFYPHVRIELKALGEKAGVNVVVPNSKLITALMKLLTEEDSPRS